MKLTNIVFCLTLLAAVAASCIREDMDDCLSTNQLILSYKGDGTTEIFPEKIDRVEMFVFDAENKCVNSFVLPQDQVDSRTATLPPLAAGEYTIVCVGNTYHTGVMNLNAADLAQILFADRDYLDHQTVHGNDSLYYACTPFTVLPYTGREEENRTQVIEFASSHYDLLVEVAGITATSEPGGQLPYIEVSGLSPQTDFLNHAGGEATLYALNSRHDPAQDLLTAFANIMRHRNHEDVVIRLYPAGGGEPLVEINLAEFLAEHPEIDCSKHEVLIPIRIEFKSGDVTIGLPDWFVQYVKPEF